MWVVGRAVVHVHCMAIGLKLEIRLSLIRILGLHEMGGMSRL